MAHNYPTIGEYNQLIQKKGGSVFRSLNSVSFIPSRTTPIKVYLFGSGAFAAVFKGFHNGSYYAIRCFLTAEDETSNRYKSICGYLNHIKASWKTGCDFIENEIVINGTSFPVLKMEWVNGILINQFISNNLSDNNVLSELQQQLVSLSNDLEKHRIGHGDLQCGNIIIVGEASLFQIKLIDYDGMFVPELASKKSTEKGRSEFQHPKRTINDFFPEMDRFSFWVMITALEAIKHDKSLWREVMQGGFNTLDNFLFTIQDFLFPEQSLLFNRLFKINSTTLKFYLETLRWLCNSELYQIPKPTIHDNSTSLNYTTLINYQKTIPKAGNPYITDNFVPSNKFKIIATNVSASVLTSNFKKIGITPIELDKELYVGKMILISNGKETKQINLTTNQNIIEVNFD